MIYRVITKSRQAVEDLLNTVRSLEHSAIISICSHVSQILMTKKRIEELHVMDCHYILPLVFEDIRKQDESKLLNKHALFNEDMAHQIVSFLDVLRDKEIATLFIHCDAGVSRSGAVGIFAVRYLGMDEKEFLGNNIIYPNSTIYDILMKVSGLRGDFEKFWENDFNSVNPKIIFS